MENRESERKPVIRTDIIADKSLLDETQCYECHSDLTTPQTYTLVTVGDERALLLDTDDCGGICFGCLKKKEKQLYERKIIL